nr:putative disease resistance protein rga4 [Quercus suber]
MTLNFIKNTEALPDEWMSNLSSLRKLSIEGGSKLKSLSLAVPHLTSLERLEIRNCELFDSINDMGDDGTEWQHLKCLSSLRYSNVPNLKSIPSGLQHVTALRKLEISKCPKLTSIPNGISNLTQILLGYLKNTSPLSLDHATRNITSDLMGLIIDSEYRQAWNITEKICCLFTASCYSNYLATTEKLRVIGVCLPEL